jgi:uncharacterized protein YutE (UPF0331/DUF86 family)
VRRRLLRLEEVIVNLGRLQEIDLPGADLTRTWAVERGLHLGAEIVFDVGNHILSAHYAASADDYEDILSKLGTHGVIDAPLREMLRGLGGFRNVLVHGYLALDADRVREAHRRAPEQFSAFAAAVRTWLDRTAP